MARATKEERNLRAHLKDLVGTAEAFLRALDGEMHGPPTVERGRRIAALSNALEMEVERAKYFGLNIDFRTGKPRKEAKPKAVRAPQ